MTYLYKNNILNPGLIDGFLGMVKNNSASLQDRGKPR
jgi:hypothetical protein